VTSETFRSAPLIHRGSHAPWILGGAILAVALLATALGAYWLGRNTPGEQGAQEGASRFSARATGATSSGLEARTAEVEKRSVKEGPAPASSPEPEGASRFSPTEGATRFPTGATRFPSFPTGPSPSAAGAASPEPTPAVLPRTTTPAAPPQPTDPVLRLEGIVGSASDPVAVINGSLVGVGDLVTGYRVLRIDGDRVELGRDGRTILLKLR
jgi:hypothetical protein